MMNEFEATLHDQVTAALRTLVTARRAGHDYEAHLHVSRIRDLLEVAARHGIHTDGWVEPAVLDSATLGN